MPRQWYNVIADLPVAAAAAAASGHPPAGRARRPRAAVPGRADRAGGLAGSVHRDPRRRARRLPAVAAHAAVPGPAAGEGPRHPGPDLLQVRGRQPGRLAQAQHRGAAGVLQRRRGRDQADHRDRRGPVGQRAGVRVRAVRPGPRGVDGPRLLRPEAVPQDADGDLRGDGAPEPVRRDQRRAGRARRAPGLHRQPGHRDQRGRRGRGRRPGHQVRAGQRAQPRAACTRRSSARRRSSSSRRPATRPT